MDHEISNIYTTLYFSLYSFTDDDGQTFLLTFTTISTTLLFLRNKLHFARR